MRSAQGEGEEDDMNGDDGMSFNYHNHPVYDRDDLYFTECKFETICYTKNKQYNWSPFELTFHLSTWSIKCLVQTFILI